MPKSQGDTGAYGRTPAASTPSEAGVRQRAPSAAGRMPSSGSASFLAAHRQPHRRAGPGLVVHQVAGVDRRADRTQRRHVVQAQPLAQRARADGDVLARRADRRAPPETTGRWPGGGWCGEQGRDRLHHPPHVLARGLAGRLLHAGRDQRADRRVVLHRRHHPALVHRSRVSPGAAARGPRPG